MGFYARFEGLISSNLIDLSDPNFPSFLDTHQHTSQSVSNLQSDNQMRPNSNVAMHGVEIAKVEL